MPQPDGEVQIPRPVVPDPAHAPGNDAPEPQAVFSFHVPLLVFSCSSLVCVVFVILHVTGLCKCNYVPTLILGGVRGGLLVLSGMSFGVPCCHFPRSWVFGLYIRIILNCL